MTIVFRIAAAQLALLSLGFGIAGVFGAEYAARTHNVWRMAGFPTYSPQGFAPWGIDVDIVPAILAFVGACLVGVIAAVLLWIRSTALAGAVVAVVAVALQAVFWVGFVLPFGPPGGFIVIILIVVGLLIRGRPPTIEQ